MAGKPTLCSVGDPVLQERVSEAGSVPRHFVLRRLADFRRPVLRRLRRRRGAGRRFRPFPFGVDFFPWLMAQTVCSAQRPPGSWLQV